MKTTTQGRKGARIRPQTINGGPLRPGALASESGGLVRSLIQSCTIAALALWACAAAPRAQPVTELFMRGYSVIPSPQKVQLSGADIDFGPGWSYDTTLPASHFAVRTLLADLKEFHS